MPGYLRRSAFNSITKVGSKSDEEFDLEVGLNLLFFYNALDKGEFSGRENDWVTVHNQRIIEYYGQKYDDDKLNSIFKTMPDYMFRRIILSIILTALMIGMSDVFMVSIGDDTNWTKWVPAKIQVWEEYPGDQVEDALIGNDVTDQLAYLHEPVNPVKFLDVRDLLHL
ncbi:unnamed protein product [Rhizophagus irregularis]|uniref:Uncharacterized protein n=1 Tax=Rhizophagus irregularis TaxID=588596 RepID=A0A916E4P0_9GLOM|nr:unnamed protein product [Rhizophagus irregularis]